jgi:tetratricopeptide (TPR) repeat protein
LLLLWWKRPKLDPRRDLLPLAPMFALGLGMGLVTIWMERHSVGAQGADWALSFADRVLIAGRGLWFYAFKLVWPQKLTFIYPRWSLNWETGWEYLLPATAMGLLAMLWIHRQRVGKGVVVAVAFFVLTLAPALGFINFYPMIYSFVADHFQYLASIGLIALAAAGSRKFQISNFKFQIAGAIVVLLLAFLTWRQAHIYRNVKTLWEDTLRKNPSAWMAHNNLGGVLADEGDLDGAIRHYYGALELKPDHEMAHYNLGIVLAKQGKLDEAVAHYTEAIRINPDYAQARNNFGGLLCQGGMVKEGIEQYLEALRINPDYADAHSNLGVAYLGLRDYDKALLHCNEAIQINPEMAEAYNNLGSVLVHVGKLGPAADNFRRAVELDPDYATAHANLGRALTELGRPEEAVVHYQAARRLDPAAADAVREREKKARSK